MCLVFQLKSYKNTIIGQLCISYGFILFLSGTIFAYGQSGSGKTYTISGNKMQAGILELAMNSIFRYIEQVCYNHY